MKHSILLTPLTQQLSKSCCTVPWRAYLFNWANLYHIISTIFHKLHTEIYCELGDTDSYFVTWQILPLLKTTVSFWSANETPSWKLWMISSSHIVATVVCMHMKYMGFDKTKKNKCENHIISLTRTMIPLSDICRRRSVSWFWYMYWQLFVLWQKSRGTVRGQKGETKMYKCHGQT